MDFAELVRVFDEYGVTFVSVTQSFNTTTSMGRLTLNVLLSFAQFEREVAGERIRDKIEASKRKGMWMGGVPPVGYEIRNRQLIVNKEEIKTARHIFDRYLVLGSVRLLKRELEVSGIKSPARVSLKGQSYGSMNFSRGALYAILKNPAYIGKISHKGKIYDGLHDAIIPTEIWNKVQSKLKEQAVARTSQTTRRHMLQGLIYDPEGTVYSPTFTARHDRQYCYYVSQNRAQNRDHPNGLMSRLPAHEIESTVEKAIRREVKKFCGDSDGPMLDHIVSHQDSIPAYDLIQTCVTRIKISVNQIAIQLNAAGFPKLVKKYLGLDISGIDGEFEITVSYKTGKARSGAVVIKPETDSRDIFDIPAANLKKLVQGVVWRDEHFSGKSIVEIARREKCSDAYVGKCILQSFEFPQAA